MTTRQKLACALVVATTVLALVVGQAAGQEASIQAVRVREPGPFRDPAAAFWKDAPVTPIVMLPQAMTLPSDLAPAVQALQVRAVHDGRWLGVLIEWKDASKSDRLVVDQFGDQVAVEFPSVFKKDALPSPMMGNPGGRVAILQWRAAFQQDLDRGRPQNINDLYPNAHTDLYPDQVLKDVDARPYSGALAVGNPITHAERSPVLEQVAEGWGSLTTPPSDLQHADGKGVWSDGTWRVVITHPFTGAEGDVAFTAGGETAAAFAVWDGGNREVGSRKAWSTWVPVKLAE
jgi:hypothetical protein